MPYGKMLLAWFLGATGAGPVVAALLAAERDPPVDGLVPFLVLVAQSTAGVCAVVGMMHAPLVFTMFLVRCGERFESWQDDRFRRKAAAARRARAASGGG